MALTGKEGGPIERADARRWTANYRASGTGKTNSHLFGAETVKQLLEQPGCVGLRLYYALNDEGQQQMLLVATDAEGSDLPESDVLDKSMICPPDCMAGGDLDS